ncbi:hypothetical protein [Caballeronia sordidicola]|uniref:hypothetical protein n=1 Tax=Caballeronia sordidicola TaxID=196367 RepID=UPI000A37DAA3|nr:hypothetical protein [Caballeronia sordidicola]
MTVYISTYDWLGCLIEDHVIHATVEEVAQTLETNIIDVFGIELESSQVSNIESKFKISIKKPFCRASVRPQCFADTLPYAVHTNRELQLVVSGLKPLAVFSEHYPEGLVRKLFPESAFDELVAAGKLIKREFIEHDISMSKINPANRNVRTRYILFSTMSEEWRIDAYILLLFSGMTAGYGELYDRMQGSLLGYEEWQNAAFIKATRER